jgi:plasmid stability protein
MARLTITLSDERHQQLRMRAAKRGKSIGQLIEEELDAADERARKEFLAILEKAWQHADTVEPALSEEEMMDLAVDVTHEVRAEIARERAARAPR